MNANLYREGSRRHAIAQMASRGRTEMEVYESASEWVRNQVRPWIFKANVEGRREAKPINLQLTELRHEIARTFSDIQRHGNPVTPTPNDETPEPVQPEPKPPVRAKGKVDKAGEKMFFLNEWKRIRRWIHETVDRVGSTPVDSLDTMRPVIGARTMIDNGISARLCLFAMALHWPQATRDQAGIETVDFLTESEALGDGFHRLAGYVRKLMNARQPIMLIGPAGTGKSWLAKQAAAMIQTEAHPDGLPYGETPMTPGATRGDLLGRHTLDGFISSQFVEIYSGGGVFNFEEIDASDPSMLIVVNNALASNELFNSANGEVYKRHEDFIPVATANTFGLGADAKYTGREKLDLATIDRFRMGRVLVDLDESLAETLILG